MPPAPNAEAHQLVQVLVTLGLTIIMGLEREEKRAADRSYIIGGVRTFPLVGLLGYTLSLLSDGNPWPVGLGVLALSAFLVVSYHHKLRDGNHGATTEVAVLTAYVVGALVARDLIALAAAVSVASVMLLQAKVPLERWAARLPREEVSTFARFILLALVILPALPNQDFTPYHLNPYKTWLIVVAVSGLSYSSYLIQRLTPARQSLLLTALLGGAYSSTLTTVVLAKHGREQPDRWLHAGCILMASGVMYVRLAVLLWVFNSQLGWLLGPRVLPLALVGTAAGFLMATVRGAQQNGAVGLSEERPRNPLEIGTALVFAGLFLGISILTQLAARALGATGVYILAAVMGVTDIDPFVLGLTQTAGQGTSGATAAVAVMIAAASNNVAKGVYAMMFGERLTGLLALACLVALTALSLLALVGLQ